MARKLRGFEDELEEGRMRCYRSDGGEFVVDGVVFSALELRPVYNHVELVSACFKNEASLAG